MNPKTQNARGGNPERLAAEHGDDGNHSTRTPEYLSPATDWHPIRPIARIRVSWIGTTGKQVNRYYADSTMAIAQIEHLEAEGRLITALEGLRFTEARKLVIRPGIRPADDRWWT